MKSILKTILLSTLIAAPLFFYHPAFGTGTTTDWYEITGDGPFLHLNDTGVTPVTWYLDGGYLDTQFDISYNAGGGDYYPFVIEAGAPNRSFYMSSAGNVGFGTEFPQRPVDVRGDGDDFAAQVYVYNQNTATPGVARKLFQIVNGDGPAKFSMFAGWGDEWAFNALANAFRISKQGTGVVEMELNQNGNLTIAGTLSQGSSRAIKHDIVEVDTKKVLNKVLALPVAEWTYNHDTDGTRHMGPMAEDFHQVFGLGDSDKKLTTVDTSGVALAAIQGLNKVLEEKDKEIEALRSEMDKLKAMVQALAAKDKIALNQ